MMVAFELTNQRQGRAVLGALRRWSKTGRGEARRLERGFFDTFDWRLWRAGAALSSSRHGAQHLLHWRPEEGGAEQCLPVASLPDFAWDLPPGRLRQEVGDLVAMRRLLPRVGLERRSETVRLLDRRDKTVARLRLEACLVRGAGSQRPIRLAPRLTAAAVRGYDRHFTRLLGFLEDQGLERATQPLLDQAYAACGLQPGDYSASARVPLDPEMPAHLAMRRIHLQLLDTIRRNEDGLRRNLDSEFLHDFRVALRRTRAALGQIKGVLPPERAGRFRQEFSWLAGRTGTLRDLDVYLLKLDDYRTSLSADAAEGLGELEALLRRRQSAEHRRVTRTLATRRYRRLLADWEEFLAEEDPSDMPAKGLKPIARVARDRILAAHAVVVRKGRAIQPATADAKLHRLRIDCKKLRYLLEFFRDLYELREIAKVIRALKGLQANLGDFNDLSVQQGAMERFAEDLKDAGAPAAALLAMGQLIANLAGRHDKERRRFHQRFERFDRRKVRRRLVRLVEGAGR